MIRILGTIFAALLGLAFGSFLNVCLSRWPTDESIVSPRSHCRNCSHTLAWSENVPLLSWLALRGRCRKCQAWIGWRYPLVELTVVSLWAYSAWHFLPQILDPSASTFDSYLTLATSVGRMFFFWLLVALIVLDAENLWLPDWITLPGILIGSVLSYVLLYHNRVSGDIGMRYAYPVIYIVLSILAAAALILLIRWLYKLIRRREGIGLGDAKLMALLAAWLGLPGALLSFGIGVVLGALVAVVLLMFPSSRPDSSAWARRRLPLGTFLCIGGIVTALWEQPIIAAYRHWAGF
jgi:leader peptidase (prepilin peptidase)/N-methyltransferase